MSLSLPFTITPIDGKLTYSSSLLIHHPGVTLLIIVFHLFPLPLWADLLNVTFLPIIGNFYKWNYPAILD